MGFMDKIRKQMDEEVKRTVREGMKDHKVLYENTPAPQMHTFQSLRPEDIAGSEVFVDKDGSWVSMGTASDIPTGIVSMKHPTQEHMDELKAKFAVMKNKGGSVVLPATVPQFVPTHDVLKKQIVDTVTDMNTELQDDDGNSPSWWYETLMVDDAMYEAIQKMYLQRMARGIDEMRGNVALKAQKVGANLPDSKYVPKDPDDEAQVKAPVCPDHHVNMSYDMERALWRCRAQGGCKKIARPAGPKMEKHNQPQVLKSDIEVVIVQSDYENDNTIKIDGGRFMEVYLRIKSHNTLIPLAKYYERLLVNTSGDSVSSTVNLHLQNLPIVDVKSTS